MDEGSKDLGRHYKGSIDMIYFSKVSFTSSIFPKFIRS